MSKDDEDITRIEDLPDINRSEEPEDDIPDLDSMAKSLGLKTDESQVSNAADMLSEDLPDLPAEESNSDFSESDFSQSETHQSDDELSELTHAEFSETNFPDTDFGEADFGEADFGESDFGDTDFGESDSGEDDFKVDSEFEPEDSFDTYDKTEASLNLTDVPGNDFTNELTEASLDKSIEDNLNLSARIESKIAESIDNDQKEEEDDEHEPFEPPNDSISAPVSELISADDLIENFEIDTTDNKTLIQREKESSWTKPEDFNEVKSFGNDLSYGNFTTEGNPPFSIIIKELKYYEDISAITTTLLEFNIIKEENLEEVSQNLERGQLLIPRLSEYAAIILCHKLRKFDIEILMGLTEEISPPKSYQSNDRGLTSKATLLNNKKYHKQNIDDLTRSTILTSTLPTINGYIIKEHLGVISQFKRVPTSKLRSGNIEDDILKNVNQEDKNKIEKLRLKRENLLAAKSTYHSINEIYNSEERFGNDSTLETIYEELVEMVKEKALTNEANGVLGINFSVTPVEVDQYLEAGPHYQVLCTGNMVWLEKN